MTQKGRGLKPADAVAVSSVALVLAVSYWLFLPQLQKLKKDRAAAAEQSAQAAQLQEKYNNLVSLTDTLPDAKQQLDLLTVAYPTGQQAAEAMIQLEVMAKKSGVAMVSLVPSQAHDGILSITGSFKGSYASYMTFMRELSNNVRPIAIRSLTMTTESEAQRTNLNVTMTVDFPYAVTAEELQGGQ